MKFEEINKKKYEAWGMEDLYKDLYNKVQGLPSGFMDEDDEEDWRDKKMNEIDVSLPCEDGSAYITKGSVFISPSNSGFMVFTNPEGEGVEIHCFSDYEDVLKYLTENNLMDLTETKVAENI